MALRGGSAGVGLPAAPAASQRDTIRRWRHDGTVDILLGSVVAGFAGLAYEILGGRSLGAEQFAPVSALLTLHFLAFIVVLVPLEQVTIRRLTLEPARPGIPIGAVSVVTVSALVGGGISWLLRDRLFGGDPVFALLLLGSVATHGLFAVSRGYMAGRRRYRSYGTVSAAAAVTRLAIAGVVAGLAAGAAWFGVALVAGPLVVVAWRAFEGDVDAPRRSTTVVDESSADGAYVRGLMLASAASQAMLLGGPAVVALLGAGPAEISIVFVTFSVARAPLSLGYNLMARLVPPLTSLAGAGEHDRLRRITWWVAGATATVAVLAGLTASLAGPSVIAALFGEAFRPSGAFVGVVAGGVIVAAGALVIGQVFVARGDTNRLADAWLAASATAALALVIPIEEPGLRVGVAFLAGELAAIGLLVVAARTAPRQYAPAVRAARRGYRVAKRITDVLGAAVLVVVLAPIAAAVALVVALDDGRPLLFPQTRVGHRGRQFRIWKFRTMAAGADRGVYDAHLEALRQRDGVAPHDLHIAGDPRITAAGRFLRRWSLDEIPNLWSVVRGDLSLVGPRPLLPEEVAVIESELGADAARSRSAVAPGITGLAQVEGRDDITLEQRSLLDLRYVDQCSWSFDLWILMRTARTVIRHRGV